MKHINKIILILIGCYAATACTINDPIDDVSDIGEFVPTVYWEVTNASVTAGDNVGFNVRYYSTLNKSTIENLEVWYSVDQLSDYLVTCPLFKGLKYSLNFSEVIENARPSQRIASYNQSEDYWSDTENAYVLNSTFPTSFTLKTVNWGNEKEFNNDVFYSYFPNGILENFRDSLYKRMDVPQFRELLTVHNPRFTTDEFNMLIDTVYDEMQGTVIKIKDEYVSLMKDKMYEVPVDSLIYDPDPERSYFSATFKKSFSAKACIKVIDKKGNVGVSEYKDITIN